VVCVSVCWLHLLPLQKWLNQLRCHLGYGLDWEQEAMYQVGDTDPPGEEKFLEGASPSLL